MTLGSKVQLLVAWAMMASMGCVDSVPVAPPPGFNELCGGLVQVDGDIQKALSEDPPSDAAHDLLHDAGRMVSALAEIDSQSGLNATQCTDVHNIAQDLLGAYGALDAAFESGEPPDYESMRERIQKGLVELQKIAKQEP